MAYFVSLDYERLTENKGRLLADTFEQRIEEGAQGLKVFKSLGLKSRDATGRLIPVDDPRLDPIWERAGQLNVPVLIHTADPVAFFGPFDESNERWEELRTHPDWHFGKPDIPGHDTLLAQRNRVIERHPDTTFIGAHVGNYPENLAYVAACLDRYPNFYIDTGARLGELGRHPPSLVREFFKKYQDRILFGSDLMMGWAKFEDRAPKTLLDFAKFYHAHWTFFEGQDRQIEYPCYPIQGKWHVNAVALPETVLRKFYTRNAQRLIFKRPS
jgi:predicted TIM-barrel fold metal-dependent hydrolase